MVTIPTPNGELVINDVYHVPGVDGIILSTGRLILEGWRLVYKGTNATLFDPCNNSYPTIFHNYCWSLETSPAELKLSKVTQTPSFDPYIWHVRLGHALEEVVRAYMKRHYPEDKFKWSSFFCERCAISKSVNRKSLGVESQIPRDSPLDLMVTDVAGPFEVDLHGNRYIVTLRDHATTYSFVAAIPSRDVVPDKIMSWVQYLKNRLGRYPTHVRSDNAAEYIHPLRRRLAAVGISLAPSAPYCPQQNGEAERLNRTIGDMGRTMLHESKLPHRFWGYAWSTAAHMHNRLPNSKTDGKVPLELLFNVKPNPDILFPFGARALIHIPKERRTTKLEERAQEAQLIGYPESGAGWLFFAPDEKRAIHSTAAKFPDFQELPVKNRSDKNNLDFILKQIMMKLGEEKTDEIAAEEKRQIDSLDVGPEIDLPKNIKAALAGIDSVEWREAAGYEMKKFEELDVWVAVDPFKGMKVLGARWVFSIKRKVDGTIDKFRARYVAKGFNQQLGVDCNETYAPTASLNTLRLLISMANRFNFPTATFDVSSAYLYSPIEEEVYVQPPVEIFPHLKGKVMKLKKALYGTKQAARCWWKFFKQTVEGLGFTASEIEPSLYLFKKGEGFVIIWLHVDDGFAMASDVGLLNQLRDGMMKGLEVKWSSKVERLVGINIKNLNGTVTLNQSTMAQQIVDKYKREAHLRSSPLNEEALEISSGAPIDSTGYRSVIGSLMYLSAGTRPDLAYPVNLLARFSANPSESHWRALDCLVGYVKKTAGKKLEYKGKGEGLRLWTEANWGGEHERSTTGYVMMYGGDAIAWGSRRQTVVALSTCAAEYLALSEGSQHLAHMLNILGDLDHHPKLTIHVDNEAAILIATDNASKKKTRYLQRAFYFVNDLIRANDIALEWTSTVNQVADVLTKRLGPTKMMEASGKLGIVG
ncbi:hypothetical protein Pst134EA_033031 [Puccinia striiformis f. sp. tritici]|uniref:hypothetical protein n=1 Tax=Puccinia striiformis f. sp. tritici TaxID=168172 RepID=UPI002007DC70|nr:hypothetical protein Pst134EA_033031 [Puccinia striiformis f. sp. tritici]KAH9459513.1 hypothetical protein Pst134EA_033031 [Puccinia striiformis f. sp. tritici]